MAQNFFLKEPAPTKVQVVNEKGEEVEVKVSNLPLTSNGSVSVTGTVNNISGLRPSGATAFNLFLDNILLLQSDGTFVPIPLCTVLTNVTNTQINNALASYKSAYATLVSGVTAATLHYSKMTNTGVVTSEVYDLKD